MILEAAIKADLKEYFYISISRSSTYLLFKLPKEKSKNK